ncbi:MAG TPA: DUF427 domain-containing protein [Acidimicrobiia bacterium]|nr:DUF427 domain-containing protein [Acidimicrobiia bacterium]
MAEQHRGRVRVEPGAKRVRAYLGGQPVLDTTHPTLVWEVPYYPAYYVPRDDVLADLKPSPKTDHSPSRGDATYFDVVVGTTVVETAASQYPTSPLEELRELIRLDWNAMDAWFEEDVEVFVHPRDPYTRIDTLPSSRHVEVIVDGVTVADSTHPTLLFETGLPPRYYVPKTDVRLDLLRESPTTSACPYKGFARYWSVDTGRSVAEDVAWSYPTPLPESERVAGLVAFYNERVDLRVDGEMLERPRTHFS